MGFQVQDPSQKRLMDVLGEEYMIPKGLMARYEAILFLAHHRFNIPDKKKLQAISLADFEFCAVQIMNSWCVKLPGSRATPTTSPKGGPSVEAEGGLSSQLLGSSSSPRQTNMSGFVSEQYSPFELDGVLFSKFRDFKNRAIGSIQEVVSFVSNVIQDEDIPCDKKKFEAKFKNWFRSLLGLTTTKKEDLREFFDNLVSDVIEPVIDMKIDIATLFELVDRALSSVFSSVDILVWQSLSSVLKPCTLHVAQVLGAED